VCSVGGKRHVAVGPTTGLTRIPRTYILTQRSDQRKDPLTENTFGNAILDQKEQKLVVGEYGTRSNDWMPNGFPLICRVTW
jgi:hypothetical protein